MINRLEKVWFCHLPQSAFPKCVFRDINSTRCPIHWRKNPLVNQVWQMLHIIVPSRNSEYATEYKRSENSWSWEKAFQTWNFLNLICAKSSVTYAGEMPSALCPNGLPIYTQILLPQSLFYGPSSRPFEELQVGNWNPSVFSITLYWCILKHVILINGEIIVNIFP